MWHKTLCTIDRRAGQQRDEKDSPNGKKKKPIKKEKQSD
jgi:hypothetical protein